MSLQRMRLRNAFVRCLEAAPFPTIAGARVFDSRIGAIKDQADDQMMPFIAVYTDADLRVSKGASSNTFERTIDVVLEIAVGTWVTPDNTDERVFVSPQTDAELEALLDILEFQIWRTIYDQVRPQSIALQKLLKEVKAWDSKPGRSPEGNNKIAARQLTLSCWVSDDLRGEPCEVVSVASLFPTYLTGLVADIQSNPAYASVLETLNLATGQQAPPAETPIAGFNVQVDLVQHETQQPDGQADITANWQTPTSEE